MWGLRDNVLVSFLFVTTNVELIKKGAKREKRKTPSGRTEQTSDINNKFEAEKSSPIVQRVCQSASADRRCQLT